MGVAWWWHTAGQKGPAAGECSGIGQRQKTGPTPGPPAVVGPLALVCSPVVEAHSVYRPAGCAGLSVHMVVAFSGDVSAGTHADAEAWAGCWCGAQALAGTQERDWGKTQMAGVSEMPLRWKLERSAGFWQWLRCLCFPHWRLPVLSTERVTVRHGHSAMWLLLVAPAFLPVSSHVVHQFGQSSLRVSEIGPLQSVVNTCRTWSLTQIFSSWEVESGLQISQSCFCSWRAMQLLTIGRERDWAFNVMMSLLF